MQMPNSHQQPQQKRKRGRPPKAQRVTFLNSTATESPQKLTGISASLESDRAQAWADALAADSPPIPDDLLAEMLAQEAASENGASATPPSDAHKATRGRPTKAMMGGMNKRESDMAAKMAGLYGSVGAMLFLVNPTDGTILLSGAGDRGKEIVMVARHHPQMWKALEVMTTASDYTPFIIGHGMMIVAILQNHNVLPSDLSQLMARKPKPQPTPQAPFGMPSDMPPPPQPQAPPSIPLDANGFPIANVGDDDNNQNAFNMERR